jgi:hypothetical protein
MTQTRYRTKVQNWHRPLGPRQLGRWFRRHRYDPIPDDCYWDDSEWDEDRSWEADAQDRQRQELKQLLREVRHRPALLFPLDWSMEAALQSDEACAGVATHAEDGELLELRLAEFVIRITRFPNDPDTRRRIIEAIGDDVYLDVIQAAEKHSEGQALVTNLCLFAPFWIRSPRTWIGGKTSLIDHLLVRYDVPRFLYREWSEQSDFPRLKWFCWFILLAQGGSLRRAAGLFDWNIFGRFEHYLRMASPGATPKEACTVAQVMRMGGLAVDCRRILSNPAFVVDTTEAPNGESFLEFWEEVVCWIIAHSADLTDEQCERILAWVMHEHTEGERRDSQPFSMRKRGLRPTLQRSLEYQRQLERPWSCYSWQQHGWDWKPVDPALDGWSFVEVTTGEELYREGQAMRHCVSGYAGWCVAGHSAIVSMRFEDARRITVEIDLATGVVSQARGTCNRPASSEEERVIRLWMEAIVRPALSERS